MIKRKASSLVQLIICVLMLLPMTASANRYTYVAKAGIDVVAKFKNFKELRSYFRKELFESTEEADAIMAEHQGLFNKLIKTMVDVDKSKLEVMLKQYHELYTAVRHSENYGGQFTINLAGLVSREITRHYPLTGEGSVVVSNLVKSVLWQPYEKVFTKDNFKHLRTVLNLHIDKGESSFLRGFDHLMLKGETPDYLVSLLKVSPKSINKMTLDTLHALQDAFVLVYRTADREEVEALGKAIKRVRQSYYKVLKEKPSLLYRTSPVRVSNMIDHKRITEFLEMAQLDNFGKETFTNSQILNVLKEPIKKNPGILDNPEMSRLIADRDGFREALEKILSE